MYRGGRKKGVKNKSKGIAQQLAEKLGIDPLAILLNIADGNWKQLGYPKATMTKYTTEGEPYEVDIITLKDRAYCASEAAQYILPKRKAVDISGDMEINGDLDVLVTKKDMIKTLAKNPKALIALEQLSVALKKDGSL